VAHLEIRDLTIEYRQGEYLVRPIDALNVDASDGELLLLLGPSGSGKTTLLSCLAGILRPTAGRIRVGGVDVTALRGAPLARYRRDTVGIVFQAFNLIPSLSARENVMAPLRLAGVPTRIARPRAEELLAMVGLEHRMDHRPKALSGGQQQRVAIARALAHEPPLLVADEPTAHLDYIQVEEILRIVRELATSGRLVVIATHDERIIPLADRTIELVPKGTPAAKPPQRLPLEAGQMLFKQGSPSDFIYVVDEGEIELQREGVDYLLHTIRVVGPGNYFGELGPLLGLPRSASARARTAAIVTGHSPRDFKRLSKLGKASRFQPQPMDPAAEGGR
jgi:putative ABC transport system ATP-binding protein